MTSTVADVTVIGAGPAGAAAAATIANGGKRVLLVEHGRRRAPRAGEMLQPRARQMLETLDAREDLARAGHVAMAGIVSAWGTPELVPRDFLCHAEGEAWSLDRGAFDRMLAERSRQRGAGVVTGTLRGVLRDADGWQLTIAEGRSMRRIQTRVLIDASGRGAHTRHAIGARRIHCDRLVALIAVLPASHSCSRDTRLLVESCRDGWWYSAIAKDDARVVACMTDADLIPRRAGDVPAWWRARLNRTLHVRRAVAEDVEPLQLSVAGAATSATVPAAADGWASVGDAATAMDPLSGQGVAAALESGIEGGLAALASLAGDAGALPAYARAMLSRFDAMLRVRWKLHLAERRWEDAVFWRRRHAPPSIL